jgi:hypothetical protein
MSLPPGTQLGPYEIRSQLGAGGMGEVYLVQDTQLERNLPTPSTIDGQQNLPCCTGIVDLAIKRLRRKKELQISL